MGKKWIDKKIITWERIILQPHIKMEDVIKNLEKGGSIDPFLEGADINYIMDVSEDMDLELNKGNVTIELYEDDKMIWDNSTANHKKKFKILSPDGFDIRGDVWTYSEEEVEQALSQFIERYRSQGYYSSNYNGRIPFDQIRKHCKIINLDE